MARSSRSKDLRLSRRAIEHSNPSLKQDGYRISSPKDDRYNCIAFAADDKAKRWWPILGVPGTVWPSGAPVERTLDAFIAAFETLGYTICGSDTLEPGFEKVAIFVKKDILDREKPTHMAWQSSTGKWKSKLGDDEDITHHTLNGLEGGQYGEVAAIMRRRRKPRHVK